MPIYAESNDRQFDLAGDEAIDFEITTFNGTEVSVSFGFPPKTVNSENRTTQLTAGAGATVIFTGSMNNPMGNNNKVKHTLTQGGETLEYVFPDDYEGDEPYTAGSGNTDYRFKVKFQ